MQYEMTIEGEDSTEILADNEGAAWEKAKEIVRGGDWSGCDAGPVKVYLHDADGDLVGTRMIEVR